MIGNDSIYLDNGSTTRMDKRVFEEMIPYLTDKYGNASSTHSFGARSREAIDDARMSIADLINAEPDGIVFTSGGTESDNLALKGIAYRHKKGNIITSTIEHPAVLNTCKYLEKNGFSVTYVPVTQEGIVEPDAINNSITSDTILISIMHANNEIGTIQPIKEIGRIARESGIPFHTDAVQSVGKIATDVHALNVDMLSISSHKFHGPKGIGALYVKKGTKLFPLAHGGGHEKGIRAGTENVPGIVGFGAAARMAAKEIDKNDDVKRLRDRLIDGIIDIKDTRLNGTRNPRLPNNVNISFKFIEGEGLVLALDANGIYASTASACSSQSLKPSHVLLAIGLMPEDAHGSLRLTLSKYNTDNEIDRVLEILPKTVESLRSISPFTSDDEMREFKEKHTTEVEHVH
ncbi:MAG: cysteine desulfurase NifS [Candidatus Micrarchaeota archaeon]